MIATSDGKTRIVTGTSSSGHHFGRLDFDSNALYCQGKFVRPEAPLSRSTEFDTT
jgi:hypothetical protein